MCKESNGGCHNTNFHWSTVDCQIKSSLLAWLADYTVVLILSWIQFVCYPTTFCYFRKCTVCLLPNHFLPVLSPQPISYQTIFCYCHESTVCLLPNHFLHNFILLLSWSYSFVSCLTILCYCQESTAGLLRYATIFCSFMSIVGLLTKHHLCKISDHV